jgi:exo-1,4-beta-D-glucosaminidase
MGPEPILGLAEHGILLLSWMEKSSKLRLAANRPRGVGIACRAKIPIANSSELNRRNPLFSSKTAQCNREGIGLFGLCRPLLVALFILGWTNGSTAQTFGSRLDLHQGWSLQSSCVAKASGSEISTVGFDTKAWHRATVPTTVLAALVADRTDPDPYPGDNLRSLPGEAYSTDFNFVLEQMPTDSPYHCSWWYHTEFSFAPTRKNGHAALHFDGINGRANIWLNGEKIADATEVAGADRTYEFDITRALRSNAANALAVEVFAPTPDDFGINWVDWNPAPPDKDMGLWRDVYLTESGPVAIRYPQVITQLSPSGAAELAVELELHNLSGDRISGRLRGQMDGIRLRQKVSLEPHQWRTIRFRPEKFPQLRVQNPKLWWPAQMGDPALHGLHVWLMVKGKLADDERTEVGFRQITSSLDDHGNRQFRINGKRIFIRGAGWAPDMLLRESPDRLRAEFDYVRDLNLNAIRLEGKLETEDFLRLADERGLLLLPGWSCCDLWQEGAKWTPDQFHIATESLRSEIFRLRGHPSVLVWLNGSDEGAAPNVEEAYIALLKELDWPNPYLFSAAGEPSKVSGPTGVKMTGPYDYVPPDFWLSDDGHNGGAAGFNTETSPGAAIPPKASLAKMLGATHLDLGDPMWTFHSAQGTFSKLEPFNETMNAVYGAPPDLDDYERKAQAMNYDAERAMFEAYTRNKYSGTTGIIQWMLNSAWPSIFWHLYDYYLQPAGGYFGAKKALEPLHIQYSYDDRSVVIVNSTYAASAPLKVNADVYDATLRKTFSWSGEAAVPADAALRVTNIPAEALGADSPLHYLELSLVRPDGGIASTNFYWLSSDHNIFDWSQASFRYTPVMHYENLQALESLKSMNVRVSLAPQTVPNWPKVTVHIANPSTALAFQIHLGIRRHGEDSEIVPVLWSDNYFELLPGESRDLTASYDLPSTSEGTLELVVNGWNIDELTIQIPVGKR